MAVVMAACNVATSHSTGDDHRTTLARLARAGVVVVDDRTLADYHPAPAPTAISAVAAVAEHRNVITVGSFNKIYWGGLRVGWIRVDPGLVEAIVRTKSGTDAGCSVPSQLLLAKLLPHHAAIVERRRSQVARRRLAVAEFIRRELPDWRVEGAGIGPSEWIRLPVRDSAEFVGFAHEHGTAVGYGGMYRGDGRPSAHLRLTLTSDDHVVMSSLRDLRDAWSEFPRRRGRRR